MNSGKVRIYELSRELDLDNKDILAICDRLNIAVKSHSSTIAESEADQIRSAAQQSRNNGGPKRPNKSRPNLVKNGNRPKQKQQILEIPAATKRRVPLDRPHRLTSQIPLRLGLQSPVMAMP